MFFSSESNNSSSSYPLFYNQSSIFTNTIPENNNNNILFHQQHFHNHNHHERYNNYIFQHSTNNHPSILENPIFKIPSINQENSNNNTLELDYPSNLMMMNHMSSTRKTANKKKDRHTKICTAQGIRDRRVRLSMSIAREFFNLQDMLGYDKASKTLGWLLGKSKAAIDELASSSNINIVTSGDDDLNEDDDCEKNGLNDDNSSSKKRKRGGEVNNFKDQNLGEEVRRREKARERARKRTRKKKIGVDDDHHHNKSHHQLENLDHNYQRGQKDSMICESSSAAATLNSAPIFSKGVNVGETVVIKGTKSRSESSFGYNYETISSKDDQENGNYYNDCFTKSASESCNYGGIMQSPGLLPALNIINLSTEIHINARPWDTYSNQNLH